LIAESALACEALPISRSDDALTGLVREHSRLVYRIAYSVLRESAEAEDAAQEVFLRVLRHEKKLGGIVDLKAWIARIAWRVAVEQRRQQIRASRGSDEHAISLPSAAIGAESVLLEKERGELLQRLIAGLPERLRDPLVLSALEELSPREIGAMLGMSEAAVRSRAFRARQILRERMAAPMGANK
jgi:RNA polymerase sigma-70 factor, ECF subfamily